MYKSKCCCRAAPPQLPTMQYAESKGGEVQTARRGALCYTPRRRRARDGKDRTMKTKNMGGRMRKFALIVLRTAYGPLLAWFCAGLPLFAWIVALSPFGEPGMAFGVAMCTAMAAAALACLVAFVASLNERAFLRALGQIAFSVAGFVAFCGVLICTLFARVVIPSAAPSCGWAASPSATR